MIKEPNLYHNPQEKGYWSESKFLRKDIKLKDGRILSGVIPMKIKKADNTLVMLFDGNVTEPIDNLYGFKTVQGNSTEHPNETDGELLTEINYFKIERMEDKPRRIRPTGIKFGILGDTEKGSLEHGVHRAMGESADYYLEGHDTQYKPGKDGNTDLRFFPFWRIGVWGDPIEQAKNYLPSPQKINMLK